MTTLAGNLSPTVLMQVMTPWILMFIGYTFSPSNLREAACSNTQHCDLCPLLELYANLFPASHLSTRKRHLGKHPKTIWSQIKWNTLPEIITVIITYLRINPTNIQVPWHSSHCSNMWNYLLPSHCFAVQNPEYLTSRSAVQEEFWTKSFGKTWK